MDYSKSECVAAAPQTYAEKISGELMNMAGYMPGQFADSILAVKKSGIDLIKGQIKSLESRRKELDFEFEGAYKALEALEKG
jgi:hypothetical protein